MINTVKKEEEAISPKPLLGKIDHLEEYEKLEGIFELEAEFIRSLRKSQADEAKRIIQKTVKLLVHGPKAGKVERLQAYLMHLSIEVSRNLYANYLTVSQAIAFQDKCRRWIYEKVTEETAENTATELVEFFFYALKERKRPKLKHKAVNDALVFIDEEIEAPLSVVSVSKSFSISASHLSRIFHEHTKITLVEYLNIRKVEEAQYHLRFTKKKISDISDQFSFCNQSYFTRVFKKYTGETPRRFRHLDKVDYFKVEIPNG